MLNDEQLLYQKMGGTVGIEIYRTKSSVEQKYFFLLIIIYCGVVMVLCGKCDFPNGSIGRRRTNLKASHEQNQ